MKVGLLAALLVSIVFSEAGAATVTISPPQNKTPAKVQQPKVIPAPVKPQTKTQAAAKADCPCNCPKDCPKDRKARHAAARAPQARRPHRAMHARSYRYAAAAPWYGPWRTAPVMGPPPGYEVDGLRIDSFGWTGGVGYASDGGGGGYGQAYFANGGGIENGPTYNSTGQSFQYNPSQAGPFQPRLMGGFAPPSR